MDLQGRGLQPAVLKLLDPALEVVDLGFKRIGNEIKHG